jgi:hypothetical protein
MCSDLKGMWRPDEDRAAIALHFSTPPDDEDNPHSLSWDVILEQIGNHHKWQGGVDQSKCQ